MGQPVTTNPIIIMVINMTVVFLVLAALGVVIKFIHYIDPTKPKEETATVKAKPAAVAEKTVSNVEEPTGIPDEVIAVITAAVVSCGYSSAQITAIRPLERNGWKNAGRAKMKNSRS